MLRAAAEEAGDRLLLLGVSVLTSSDEETLRETGVAGSVEEQVLRLAALGTRSGLRGVVASPLEIAALRGWLGDELKIRHARRAARVGERRDGRPAARAHPGASRPGRGGLSGDWPTHQRPAGPPTRGASHRGRDPLGMTGQPAAVRWHRAAFCEAGGHRRRGTARRRAQHGHGRGFAGKSRRGAAAANLPLAAGGGIVWLFRRGPHRFAWTTRGANWCAAGRVGESWSTDSILPIRSWFLAPML